MRRRNSIKIESTDKQALQSALFTIYDETLGQYLMVNIGKENDPNQIKKTAGALEDSVDRDLASLGRIIQDVHYAQMSRATTCEDFDAADDLNSEQFHHVTNLLGRISEALWSVKAIYSEVKKLP